MAYSNVHSVKPRQFRGKDLPDYLGTKGNESRFVRCKFCGAINDIEKRPKGDGWGGNIALEEFDGQVIGQTDETGAIAAGWYNASLEGIGIYLTPVFTGTISEVKAYIRANGAGTVKLRIYEYPGDNTALPTSVLATSDNVSLSATLGWQTLPIGTSLSLTRAVKYGFRIYLSGGAGWGATYKVPTTNIESFQTISGESVFTPYTDREFLIYTNYNPARYRQPTVGGAGCWSCGSSEYC